MIIKNFNHHSLRLHFQDIIAYPNLLASSYLLLLNETRIKNAHINSNIYNTSSQRFHILPRYNEHGTMIFMITTYH
jgi:hypothetical protein